MQINIVFGSASDKNVYEPLCEKLKSTSGINVDFQVCSAHRQPEQLRTLIKEKPCDLYITGAGLAAHLPGVVASQTLTPVIGIPVNDILNGLDAFLSILQMPKGIPVMSSGVNQVDAIVQFCKWYHLNNKTQPKLRVVSSPNLDQYITKLKEPLESIGWSFVNESNDTEVLNIHLLDLEYLSQNEKFYQDIKKELQSKASLNVPILQTKTYTGDARKIMELANLGGLWVGINNITNLQILFMQLWSIGSKEKTLLTELKEGGKKSAVV